MSTMCCHIELSASLPLDKVASGRQIQAIGKK